MKINIYDNNKDASARLMFFEAELPNPFCTVKAALKEQGRISENDKISAIYSGTDAVYLMGTLKDDTVRSLKKAIGAGVKRAASDKVRNLVIDLGAYSGTLDDRTLVVSSVVAAMAANYRCAIYKEQPAPLDITVRCDRIADLAGYVSEGEIVGNALNSVRDTVNRVSSELNPNTFTAWAKEMLKDSSCSLEVLGLSELKELGAKAFLSVSRGSALDPCMLVIRYKGNPESDRTEALIGKGITFDSGGLSLKSKTGMISMHHDMSGAAAAVAVMSVLSASNAKVNVTGIVPLCENMLANNSYRPGDIIGTMNGKTVLIKSTDAEGRLILCDAITYAIRHEHAAEIVDVATLTGGAASAYGPKINAFACTDDGLRNKLHKASESSGELVWEMPLLDEYLSYLKSDHADIANSSNGAGSAMINAALFLKGFTEGTPWLHVDCAGTAWAEKEDELSAYGATGATVCLLCDYFSSARK